MQALLRKTFYYLIMFGFTAIAIEALVVLVSFIIQPVDIYDHRQEVTSKLTEENLDNFMAGGRDQVLGWNKHGPQVYQTRSCVGVEIENSINAAGARIYPGYEQDNATIITVGDSYTHGTEAHDEYAYPARLAELLDTSVANHGVGGYGPVQSFLNLKQKIHHYPKAQVVVLGIMYENVYRMMNSYRPVLAQNTSRLFGLKPYMASGDIRPHPGRRALEDIDNFRGYAEHAFDNDFWAKPDFQFPYSLSLLRALKSNYFRYYYFNRIWIKAGNPSYYMAYNSDDILEELYALVDHYVNFARQSNLIPVVIFIPRSDSDTQSAAKMIHKSRNNFSQELIIGDVGSANIDWDKFNLRSVNDATCHPSAYGYKKIAEYVAALLGTGVYVP